ncbi:hypothetical protein BI347_10945 [Chromobacterium sphagni]|uniref:Uncharacterized protein n=1 Tax=Chromobacterium sphagni TaxID=1903179 RepID=A0A1S1X3B2_9NEIS|nr:hypothetical protein BI347_10945 [Chromobacterium sphagni]OHX20176.1 hypothetical protein BI344_06630 [Chromobacterium sphagni]
MCTKARSWLSRSASPNARCLSWIRLALPWLSNESALADISIGAAWQAALAPSIMPPAPSA